MNEVSRKILEQVNSVIIGKEAVTEKVLMVMKTVQNLREHSTVIITKFLLLLVSRMVIVKMGKI